MRSLSCNESKPNRPSANLWLALLTMYTAEIGFLRLTFCLAASSETREREIFIDEKLNSIGMYTALFPVADCINSHCSRTEINKECKEFVMDKFVFIFQAFLLPHLIWQQIVIVCLRRILWNDHVSLATSQHFRQRRPLCRTFRRLINGWASGAGVPAERRKNGWRNQVITVVGAVLMKADHEHFANVFTTIGKQVQLFSMSRTFSPTPP